MSRLKKLIKSPHIQIALTTGVSIIDMTDFSKRVLPDPIDYIPFAIPPFLATVYESLYGRDKNSKLCTTLYRIAAILIALTPIIVFNLI